MQKLKQVPPADVIGEVQHYGTSFNLLHILSFELHFMTNMPHPQIILRDNPNMSKSPLSLVGVLKLPYHPGAADVGDTVDSGGRYTFLVRFLLS